MHLILLEIVDAKCVKAMDVLDPKFIVDWIL